MTSNVGGRKMMSPCRSPARGFSPNKDDSMRQLNVTFDRETALLLRAEALKQNRSVSEIVRTYVEWGIEAAGK